MTLHHGDCLEVMAGMDPESVDAIVTDPPYNLTDTTALRLGNDAERSGLSPVGRSSSARGFMGKRWDGTGVAFQRETWAAALRVAKPSAYLLAFGGTRTVHRMTCSIEDAGWIVRDMLVWAYASGFPKSKASLKPAWEPIVMARKPGPLRMLAIDECRIPGAEDGSRNRPPSRLGSETTYAQDDWTRTAVVTRQDTTGLGRWPANVILTDPIFDGGVEGVVGGGSQDSPATYNRGAEADSDIYGDGLGVGSPGGSMLGYGDSGTYSRFFILPKADRADREPVITPDGHDPATRFSTHPTVKPVDLMRHLVRLVTPTRGIVLDPFLGSGTTAIAAEMEGFGWVGIEREAEYVAIAEARLNGVQRGLGLETA